MSVIIRNTIHALFIIHSCRFLSRDSSSLMTNLSRYLNSNRHLSVNVNVDSTQNALRSYEMRGKFLNVSRHFRGHAVILYASSRGIYDHNLPDITR